jgi:hypothetical protein
MFSTKHFLAKWNALGINGPRLFSLLKWTSQKRILQLFAKDPTCSHGVGKGLFMIKSKIVFDLSFMFTKMYMFQWHAHENYVP